MSQGRVGLCCSGPRWRHGSAVVADAAFGRTDQSYGVRTDLAVAELLPLSDDTSRDNARKVNDMTGPTYVAKLEVVATLRSRELHDRADWVDRELPAFIDTVKNAALLRTLGIDDVVAVPSASLPVVG